MPDREKVVKGLEDSLTNQGCGYMDGVGELYAVSGEDLQNAIAMLKEQEPVKPREQEETRTWTVCGNCSQHLISKWLWCPYCGRKVKWDEAD